MPPWSDGTLAFTNGGATVFSFTDVALEPGASPVFTIGIDPSSGNGFAQVACFASGTQIATPGGEVAVELLQPGDQVLRAPGGVAEVIWVGRRCVDCHNHPLPASVWPVRIAAHAFAAGRPSRDLLVSPDHAVFEDGVLIPVKYLVNGRTVMQEACDSINYFHVELTRHDVLLANGLAAESFLRGGNRTAFENGGEYIQLFPDVQQLAWEAEGYAPLVVTGARLEAVQEHLFRRAVVLADRGERRRVHGWLASPSASSPTLLVG